MKGSNKLDMSSVDRAFKALDRMDSFPDRIIVPAGLTSWAKAAWFYGGPSWHEIGWQIEAERLGYA